MQAGATVGTARTGALLRPLSLRPLLAAGLLAALLAVAVRGVDLEVLRRVDVGWWWIALSLLLNLASVGFRTAVWKASLDAVPGAPRSRYAQVVPAQFVGLLLNTVLFARIGEVARVAVLRRRLRQDDMPQSGATLAGTVVSEQVVLGLSLAALVVGIAFVVSLPPLVMTLLLVFGIALAVALTALGVVLWRARTGRAGRLARGLASGHALFHRPGATAWALVAGMLSWLTQLAGIYVALLAFGLDLPVAAAGAVFVSSTLVQLFPFWPGNVGVFQLGVYAPLVHAYGVDTGPALAFAVGLQLIEAALGVGLGALFLSREGLSLADARRLSGEESHEHTAPVEPWEAPFPPTPAWPRGGRTAAPRRRPQRLDRPARRPLPARLQAA